MPPDRGSPKVVVVKFREDSRVRLKDEAFTTPDARIAAGLTQVLREFDGVHPAHLFDRPALERQEPGAADGHEARLNLYYRFDIDEEHAERLAARLRETPGVAMAYVEPEYQTADGIPKTLTKDMVVTFACPPGPLACLPGPMLHCPPAPLLFTPDFTNRQTYLDPEKQGGIDARFAWTKAGGDGAGMSFADIEFGWNIDHEDLQLPASTPIFGTNTNDEHGTKVLGEIVAKHNGYGVSGIAPAAQVCVLCSVSGAIAPYIDHAAQVLSAGDVMLIELQSNFLPIEWIEANYDSIVAAVAKGIVVVEAAGNGMTDLDTFVRDPMYGGGGYILQRAVRDSGAIVVGAGCPPSGNFGPPRSRWLYSNWGSRVDVQGQGREVCTTGGGDLFDAGPDRRYTADFMNTSAASPQVVGAVLSIQGMLKAKGEHVLVPSGMRETLVVTGSAQTDGNYGPATQHIGPEPNIHAAVLGLYPPPHICTSGPMLHCPAPFVDCRPAPVYDCHAAATFLRNCHAAAAKLETTPLVDCPSPVSLHCPPAPIPCGPGPILSCGAGPGPEDPRWKWLGDPILELRWIKDVGFAYVVRNKAEFEATPEMKAADAEAAAAYGYGPTYWSFTAKDLEGDGAEVPREPALAKGPKAAFKPKATTAKK